MHSAPPSLPMHLIVTCGPAWEPIDGMRRLTNASTGQLGSALAEAFAAVGHQVTLFRGDLATAAPPRPPVQVRAFGTNDDLARALAEAARNSPVDAVFHAAALCDFKVAAARTFEGTDLGSSRKLSSRSDRLTLDLEPATKVLPQLRGWFPKARLVGWKYELDGGRDAALLAVWRQIQEAGTDACVVNGAAWGDGFGFCEPPETVTPCADATALARTLLAWLHRGTQA